MLNYSITGLRLLAPFSVFHVSFCELLHAELWATQRVVDFPQGCELSTELRVPIANWVETHKNTKPEPLSTDTQVLHPKSITRSHYT